MVSTELKMSMIIAGRGARPCDMCGKERAKWYCAADDAYLCENCDESVHVANSVARRHERVRLGANGAPVKLKPSHCHSKNVKSRKSITITSEATPATAREVDNEKWCSSSRKRLKTARRSTNVSGHSSLNCIVPANAESSISLIKDVKKDFNPVLDDHICMDDHSGMAPCEGKLDPLRLSSALASRARPEVNGDNFEYNHEVPTYEPLLEDLIDSSREDLMGKLVPSSPPVCNASSSSRKSTSTMKQKGMIPVNDRKFEKSFDADGKFQSYDLVDGFLNDVNEGVLIIEDSDNDTFDVTDLCSNAEFVETVKLEELNDDSTDGDGSNLSGGRDQGTCIGLFQGNPPKGKCDRDRGPGCKGAHDNADPLRQCSQQAILYSPLSLRLDFEEIISAWSDRGSLWLDGQRPQIVPDIDFTSRGIVDCDMIAVSESICSRTRGSKPGQVPSLVVLDKGREARVLRYKEKRRTRLFSKRIRYEVRKLNAECRPRMKGRFVKRAAIAAMGAGRPQARV